MCQWENETSNLSIFRNLCKSLVNALALIIFLISRHQVTNEPVSSLTRWVKSIITVFLISFDSITWVSRNINQINISCKPISQHACVQLIFFYFNSLALITVELFHVLMGILSVLRIFVILLSLHLILHRTLFRHHGGSVDLHVIDDEFISKERVL